MTDLSTFGQPGTAIISGQEAESNPAAVYLMGLSAKSRETMTPTLNDIAHFLGAGDAWIEAVDKRGKATRKDAACFFFDWAALRVQHTNAVRQWLESSYKPATGNKKLCALRGVLRAAWQLNLMASDDYQKAVTVKSITGSSLLAGRDLSAGEIGGLLLACENDPSPAGARDAAVIALAYGAGLRRDEIVKIDLADYDPQTGELKILRAKRNKEREVYVENGAALALADWLAVRGDQPGPLFLAINKGGKIVPGQMTNQAVYNLLAKRAKQAGVKKFSPHDLRRTFAGDALSAGADISTVSKIMGHSSVATTGRYDRRGKEAKRKAASLLHIPYHQRQKES